MTRGCDSQGVPLPSQLDDKPLASSWPASLVGKRGRRTIAAEIYLDALRLPPPQVVAIGSVSAAYFRNTVGRIANVRLPSFLRQSIRGSERHTGTGAGPRIGNGTGTGTGTGAGAGTGPGTGTGAGIIIDAGAHDDPADEYERVLPPELFYLRRRKVPLGKFGVDEDFSFAEHNETQRLTALDNSVPNAYCNVALAMLHMLPWVRVHCLSSLMRSQFVLSDELGFLFHMMDKSRGGACQPRNFQRALHQSREATALKVVDAVDLEGNVKGNADGLPTVICKFVAFLLEQLSKEARDASRERETDELARREACNTSTQLDQPAHGNSNETKRLTLDEIVARQYAERQAAAVEAAAASGSASTKEVSCASNDAGARSTNESKPTRSILDMLFAADWEETTTFPGVADAKPVMRQSSALVLALSFAESGNALRAATVPPFIEALQRAVNGEANMKAWCAERKAYRAAKVAKRLVSPPNALCVTLAQLSEVAMQTWQ